jgi:hypothetical protein
MRDAYAHHRRASQIMAGGQCVSQSGRPALPSALRGGSSHSPLTGRMRVRGANYPVQRGISLCIDVNSLDASFVPTDKTQAMASTLSLESAHASEYVTLSPFLLAKFQVPINLAAERNQCPHHATRTTRSIGESAMGRGQALVSPEPDQQICIESGKI